MPSHAVPEPVAQQLDRWRTAGVLGDSNSIAGWSMEQLAISATSGPAYTRADAVGKLMDIAQPIIDSARQESDNEELMQRLAGLSIDGDTTASVMALAAVVGFTLMPWEIDAVRFLEDSLDDGSYTRAEPVVSVPRQCGKTTTLAMIVIRRMLAISGYSIYYTAQTGKDAGEKWTEVTDMIMSGQLASLFTVRRASGSQRLTCVNGSSFRPFAPVYDAIHGKTINMVILDEAFSLDEELADSILGAVGPAQLTQSATQIVTISTVPPPGQGTWFMNRLHRADTEGAYFGISYPSMMDPHDMDAIERWHPAVGYTMTRKQLEAISASLSEQEYCRAILNQYPEVQDNLEYELIDPALWDACPIITGYSIGTGTYVAVDVSADMAVASIVAYQPDQRRTAILCECRPDEVDEALKRYKTTSVYMDDTPSNALLKQSLEQSGVGVTLLKTKQLAVGCASFVSMVRDKSLSHPASTITDQVGAAETRPCFGGFIVKRTDANTALMATMAAIGATITDIDLGLPWIITD